MSVERAKAAPGCPFTTSAGTAELPSTIRVSASWRPPLVRPGWAGRPADVALTVRGRRAWTGL